MTRPWFRFSLALLFGLSLAACTRSGSGGTSSGPAGKLNVAIWSNLISPQVFAAFQKATGIEVAVSNYSSNEELLAKLQAGASGYDLVLPTDYMIGVMIQLKLVRELELKNIPSFRKIDPRFLAQKFDPANRYSVPFDWGMTGIAVNREKFRGELKGWKQLVASPELAGHFTLLDDVREVFGAALKANGFSLNSRNPNEVQKARDWLKQVKSRVKGFSSEPLAALTSGEVIAAHAYQSDALIARRNTGGKVEFVFPEEGGTLYQDAWVIPASATNGAAAHRFIEFMLDPAHAAQTVQTMLVAPVLPAVLTLLPAELQALPQFLPGASLLKRTEMLEDVGEALALYDKAWTEVKAGAP